MEGNDLNELEEELYSKIYHDSENSIENIPAADIVTDTFLKKTSINSRYYQDNIKNTKAKTIQRFIKPRKFKSMLPQCKFDSSEIDAKQEAIPVVTSKAFAPYSSVLFSSVLKNSESDVTIGNSKDGIIEDIQIINNPVTFKDDERFSSPVKKIIKLSKKPTKLKESLKHLKPLKGKKSKSCEIIEIISSDDDDSGSVILLEMPAPPLIAVESSSDDDQMKKTIKRINKKEGSPSTSSIISDEFVMRSDKSRMKNIFHPKICPQTPIQNRHFYEDDTSNDSIYNTKLISVNRYQKSVNLGGMKLKQNQQKSSSENEEGVVTTNNNSNSLYVDDVSEHSSDSTIVESHEKRQKFEKQQYNEIDFSSLISNALTHKAENDNGNKKDNRKKNSTANKSEMNEVMTDKQENSNNCDLILNVSSNRGLLIKETIEVDLSFDSKSENKLVNVSTIDCEIGWNDEMKYFYNEFSYGRDFNLSNIQSFMSEDDWRISNLDRVIPVDSQGMKKIRCRNCNEVGHKMYNCYRPKKKTICFMCGEVGHVETRCPNAVCLRCGKRTSRFSTVCNHCAKFGKKRCPLCKNSFHDLDQCPDKWRRYHSTTVDNGNSPLHIEYKRNDRVYCSVCAKQGHFADTCIYFNKMNNGYITSSWFAISNKPSYNATSKLDMKIRNNHVLQLITYLENYEFNFKLPKNCHFYPFFRQRFLKEKCGNYMIECSEENISKLTGEEKKRMPVRDARQGNEEEHHDKFKVPSPKNVIIDQITEAKIMIDLNRKQIMKSQKKQIQMIGAKYNVKIKFPEQTDPRHLFVIGTISNQNSFHEELRKFFFKCELLKQQERYETSMQLPSTIGKIVERLKSDLQSIKFTGIKEAKRYLESFFHSQRHYDHKKFVKYRRNLNIVFIGYGELKDGGIHVRAIKNILAILEKEVEDGHSNALIDSNLKDKLMTHMKYIFSPIDHGNYSQLFRNYKTVAHKKRSKKYHQ